MKKITILLGLTISLLIYGCSNILEPPKNVDDFAKKFVTLVQKDSINTILTFVNEDVQNEQAKDFLIKVNSELKNRTFKSVKLLNYKKTSSWTSKYGNSTLYSCEYEFVFDNLYYFFSIGVLEKDNKLEILGFNGQIFDKPIDQVVGFSFANAGFIHYFFLLFLILIPAFIIVTIVNIAKSKFKKKWIWIVASLFGVCAFYLNWTTGAFDFQILNFSLLGIEFSKAGNVAPWIAKLAIPLGAIIYWIKRPSLIYNYELEQNLIKDQQLKQENKDKQENLVKHEQHNNQDETNINDNVTS